MTSNYYMSQFMRNLREFDNEDCDEMIATIKAQVEAIPKAPGLDIPSPHIFTIALVRATRFTSNSPYYFQIVLIVETTGCCTF